MADPANLYQELKDALSQFKSFIDTNSATLKPAITALKPIVPQIGDLLTKLIDLMNQLKTTISGINVGAIPGLSQVSQFTGTVKTLLTTAEALLPQQKTAIDEVVAATDVVTGLPSLDTVKQDILNLLTGIINDLTALNS
jgi:ABC-type transporter Mla subunit MlaD